MGTSPLKIIGAEWGRFPKAPFLQVPPTEVQLPSGEFQSLALPCLARRWRRRGGGAALWVGKVHENPQNKPVLKVVKASEDLESADPGLSHGRGGAWDHLWCGLHLLPNSWPWQAKSFVASQVLRGKPSLSFSSQTRGCGTPSYVFFFFYFMRLSNAQTFKRFNPSKRRGCGKPSLYLYFFYFSIF